MARRERINSKKYVALKLFWKPFIIMTVLTILLISLKFDNNLGFKENTVIALEIFLTYLAGPIFIGYTLFALGMMKEIDEDKWEKQKEEEKRKN